METDIRLIALDLDGTFLRDDRSIPEKNAEAVRAAVRSGVDICLASGRVIGSIRPFCDLIGFRGPIVSCNGAFIADKTGREIHHSALPVGVRDIVVRYVRENRLHLNVYCR
ncbi:Cof-type HAD-IIB family hydrolase, partial [Candidatus Uhrbacteria bacterium]|nr:Cof-type HAD-IIB family hydrolase [Candidatus Uhrbacteria bacterium]